MPEGPNERPDRQPPRASGPIWLATGLAVAAVGLYLLNREPASDARPSAEAPPPARGNPAMMNNTTRLTLACTATESGTRILIAPFSRSFVAAGAYRCRPPVPPAPIMLGHGTSLDFETGVGGRITIRRPSAYPS